jgi:MoxR-like ATPase
LVETVTLGQAKSLIQALARDQSLLLLSPPGVGKSDTVRQAAAEAGLECRSLLGTQIAPEDVSGIPRIVGERSVFCPPRVLLPEDARPFCLFLDELPACAPDIQKAFYSLLLERRLGEYPLPPGTWVVAAGNRVEDRALVRALSSALVNRVILLHVRVDLNEWLAWAEQAGVRQDVRDFIRAKPESLLREVPPTPVPFSTPRAWASLAACLDLTEQAGILTDELRRALALGRVTGDDAVAYCEHLGFMPKMADAQHRLDQALADVEPLREALSISAADLPLVDPEQLRVLAVRMFQQLNTPYEFLPSMKIVAIKVLREVTKCGLKEAKDAVETVLAMTAAEREQLLAATQGP